MVYLMLCVLLLYWEAVYHMAGFGLTAVNPLFTLGLCLSLAGVEAFAVGLLRKRAGKVMLWFFLVLDVLVYGAQLVYLKLFKQPLLLSAAIHAGKDAVTNYWKETLYAIAAAGVPLVLLLLPLFLVGFLLKKGKLVQKRQRWPKLLQYLLGYVAGLALFAGSLLAARADVGFAAEVYEDFSDPKAVFEGYGVLAAMQRDAESMIGGGRTEDVFLELGDQAMEENGGQPAAADTADSGTDSGRTGTTEVGAPGTETTEAGADETKATGTGAEAAKSETTEAGAPGTEMAEAGADEMKATGTGAEEAKPETTEAAGAAGQNTGPNVLPIDFAALSASEEREAVKALHRYVESRTPTNKNAYTGMFEGYNLIFLTAEGFAPYCVDENITPTLYQLLHSGFQFSNYYVPLWQTSTSDGEFANCTGLVPDGQFSLRRTAENAMPFTLPAFFKGEGVSSLAYHNNSLSYYDRYRTHENLGYFFKAGSRGKLPLEEWKDHIFPMEHPKQWPQSDLEMMQGTLPDYLEQPRFHVYYMTVSGHMLYTFSGNAMSQKNRAAVENLPYSENAKAYVACNVELDRALEWLIAELEKAGQLEKTVICMGADHYPYGLTEAEITELRGAVLEKKRDLYHSGLVLWNASMEPVVVEKPCSSVDILPTLLNLFGFDYDSRLYSGQDILSDSAPLVIFSDRSFLTDRVYYDGKSGKTENLTGEAVDAAYVKAMKKQVKDLFTFSKGILDYDYYRTLEQYGPAAD